MRRSRERQEQKANKLKRDENKGVHIQRKALLASYVLFDYLDDQG
jgi:hypothetical protein